MPLAYTVAELPRETGLQESMGGHRRAVTLSLTHHHPTTKKREEQQAGGRQARRPGIIVIHHSHLTFRLVSHGAIWTPFNSAFATSALAQYDTHSKDRVLFLDCT